MRSLFLYLTMTLDGCVAGPNGELDWMRSAPDPRLTEDVVALLGRADAGFIGYPTATDMIRYWAQVATDPTAAPAEREIARAVGGLHAFVVSRTEEPLDAPNAELLVARDDDELVAAVRAIKARPGRDLGVPGGIRTARTFVRLGLVDEYVFLVHPVAIGAGQRLFERHTPLELVSATTYPSGVHRVVYRPA